MQGTANLVEVAKRAGLERIVLVSSIGADEPFFPLNLLFGVRTRPCLLPCKSILYIHQMALCYSDDAWLGSISVKQ